MPRVAGCSRGPLFRDDPTVLRHAGRGTLFYAPRYLGMDNNYRDIEMKGIVLWLMGVPLIVIILLYMFVF
ncbi:hypothetical protein [Sinorhizobium glycinis]|nr:hypothetical protein [Sinorhizobium glycinis]